MTKAKKAESALLDLPAGWQWDKESTGWKAINPDKNLETTGCATLKAAVAAAHRIDEKYGTDESDDDMGFHPGFPPGFDPERAAKGLPQEDKSDIGWVCRVCGCTEMDCRQCIEKTGEPCHWVEPDLCSACGQADDFTAPRCNECKMTDGGHAPTCSQSVSTTSASTPKTQPRAKSAKKLATVETVSDSDHKRLHKEALARWRREPGSGESSSNGYHPQMLRMIPVDQIAPSPTNPRKFFDQGKLQELADSIIEHGLIEPILVRPLRRTTTGALIGGDIGETLKAWPGLADNLYYELIAGERRWRAVKLAGLTKIEAKVRDLDDRAVLEIQLIENLQREDVSPVEEADGYMAMLDLRNPDGTSVYTVDSLAAKIGKKGKSKSYVYGRLKLRNLPAPALEALAKGDLPATIGELIGRLPNEKMREELWEDNFAGIGQQWFEMPSFRDIKSTIEAEYMRELKSAPFPQGDSKLVPEAGSCKNCLKRTGNNRGDYPDGRADICTDTSCFEIKLQAFSRREADKAKTAGARVLDEKETARIFDDNGKDSWLRWEAKKKYATVQESCFEDPKLRSYGQLLEGHMTPVVAVHPTGKTHLLYPKAEAEKVLQDVHGIKPEKRPDAGDTYQTSEKKRQEEKKLRQATAAEIVTRALNDVDEELFTHDKFMRILATFLIDKGDADTARAIGKRRGLDVNPSDVRGSVTAIVPDLVLADVQELIVEWLLQRELEYWANWGSDDAFALCEYFGMEPKAVMKEMAKAKKESKPKSKAKAVAQA